MSNSDITKIPDSNPNSSETGTEVIAFSSNGQESKSNNSAVLKSEPNTVITKSEEIQDTISEGMEETSLQLVNSANEHRVALSDIKSIKDLGENSVREILRKYTDDNSLEIVSIGELEDMSGMNDAFNSCICSLRCVVRFQETKGKQNITDNGITDSPPTIEKEFNFVVKCPPKSNFIQFAHKFTKPFCNEVSWYVDLVKQLQLIQPPGSPPVLGDILPKCYHAVSSYHVVEASGEGDGPPSSCW